MLAAVLYGFHGLIFRTVLLAYRWLGKPPYWPDVGPAINLRSAWVESARRSWWIWPATMILWQIGERTAQGLQFAFFPLLLHGWPVLLAHLLVITIGYGHYSSRVLREQMTDLAGWMGRRCEHCGYSLRGLDGNQCPECGRGFDRSKALEFRLAWEHATWSRFPRRMIRLAFVPVLLLCALLIPLIELGLPRGWIAHVPWCLKTPPMTRNPDAFPLRTAAICRIRHPAGNAIVQFFPEGSDGARFVVGFWSQVVDLGHTPPDAIASGHIHSEYAGTPMRIVRDPTLSLGPWAFSYSWGGERFFWLNRPGADYDVQAWLPRDFEGDLSWVEQVHDLPREDP